MIYIPLTQVFIMKDVYKNQLKMEGKAMIYNVALYCVLNDFLLSFSLTNEPDCFVNINCNNSKCCKYSQEPFYIPDVYFFATREFTSSPAFTVSNSSFN